MGHLPLGLAFGYAIVAGGRAATSLPLIGRELTAAGLAVGVVGAAYLSFGILRSPVGIASEVLGQHDADRMYPKVKHVSTVGVTELARATISGRFGLGCLVLSGVLQLAGALWSGSSERVLVPLAVAFATGVLAVLFGRRYLRRNADAFRLAIWRAPTLHEVTEFRALRNQALRTANWREGRLIQWAQWLFLPPH